MTEDTEWLRVMLSEINRKRDEAAQAAAEAAKREQEAKSRKPQSR